MEICLAAGSFVVSSGCLLFAWLDYKRNTSN